MFSLLPTNRLYRHGMFWTLMVVYFLLPQWVYPEYLTTVKHYFFGFKFRDSPCFLLLLFGYTLGIGMLYTYGFLSWVMPALLNGRYAVSVGRSIGLTIAVCYGFRAMKALHVAVLDPWLRHQPLRSIDGRHFTGVFLHQVYLYEYSTLILLVTLYKLYVNWRQNQQASHELGQQKLRHDIQLIKTRLNPGFLLTGLERLDTLIENRDPQAPAVVLTLAHFLSYVLYESEADWVPLDRDVAAMQQYTALARERFGEQIDVSVQITGDTAGLTIAPLLWLPFLESGFEHSLIPDDQAWLSLNLAVSGSTFRLKLAGSIDPAGSLKVREAGAFAASRRRLDTLYPNGYDLTIKPDDALFIVTLTLPLTVEPGSITPIHQPDYDYSVPDR